MDTPSLLVCLLGSPMLTQSQATPKLYRIAGSVTNSVSHEVVTGATLTLFRGRPPLPMQTIQTDASGHFQFEPVPAAKVRPRRITPRLHDFVLR
jgi:hypothetical protein